MLFLMLTLMLVAGPEEASGQETRAEQYRLARENKAQTLQPPSRTFLEKGLHEVKERRVAERLQGGLLGFHPIFGGMQTGAGFAFGSFYSKGGFRTAGQVSLKGYQKYETSYSAPRLFNGRVFADAYARYRNYSQEDYFGTGSDSRSEDRTSYRLEDVSYGGQMGLRLGRYAKAGTHFGWIKTNVGEGTDPRLPSVAGTFDTKSLPAFNDQPDYLHSGAFVEVDYRDEPGNPRAGGHYSVKWSSFQDRKLNQHDFNRYDLEVQQYFPFFNQRRVIALRGKTTLTQTAAGQEIPFYMLPTVGGGEDLRGFTESRFRDRNMLVLNAEYRWEAFSGLDLALFADAGQVAATARELDLGEMKTATGVGFRFNTAKSVFLRVDVGFSKEGQRVFMKFGHVF